MLQDFTKVWLADFYLLQFHAKSFFYFHDKSCRCPKREYDVVLNNAKLPFAFISVLLKIDLIHNYKQIFAICTDTINSINARSRLIYYGVKVRVGLKCTALYNKKPGDLFFWAFWLCLVSILSCIHRV